MADTDVDPRQPASTGVQPVDMTSFAERAGQLREDALQAVRDAATRVELARTKLDEATEEARQTVRAAVSIGLSRAELAEATELKYSLLQKWAPGKGRKPRGASS